MSLLLCLTAGSRAGELTRLIQFKPTADGSSFGAAVLAAAAASS
jgi:hexokinase